MPQAAWFDLVSHWRLAAPREHVWQALTRPEDWPDWWPFVRSVRTLCPGDGDGLGSVRRVEWATRLPYSLVIEVEATEVRRHRHLRVRARGQLQGEGLWLLRDAQEGTDVTYVWRVSLQRPWMRRFAPWLAPLFRWNHAAVMRAGEAGLQRHLGAPRGAPAAGRKRGDAA